MAESTEMKATIRTVPLDRAVSNGFDLCDYQEMYSDYESGTDYLDACIKIADQNVVIAEQALKDGHEMTARTFFLNASAAYRVGQYTIVPDIPQKIDLYRKLIDCYAEAAKRFSPEITRYEVPYKGNKLVGWLRMPENATGKVPIVISIGGADGWREEHHNYSALYADRGMAYLMIDGPGQGEVRLFNKLYMELDNEKALDAIVEHVSQDKRFDKVGMVGYSFGGYLVMRCASVSKKLSSAVSIGGSYRPKEIMKLIPHFRNVFGAVSGKKDDELTAFIEGMTMEGYADKITCDLLILHGKDDMLFSWKGVQRIYDEAASTNKRIRFWDDGNHCVTNHINVVTPTIADWFMDTLK